MTNKEKQIEEMAKDIVHQKMFGPCIFENCPFGKDNEILCNNCKVAQYLRNKHYQKLPKDSVVLSKEEYEKLKSLYDSQQGAYMTSSIGDLPLTVESLRKAVDEITRLIGVQTELQELNAKYYNEAKDLRRELVKVVCSMYTEEEFEYKVDKKVEEELDRVEKETSKETAEKIYRELQGHGTTYVKKWIKEQFGIETTDDKCKYYDEANMRCNGAKCTPECYCDGHKSKCTEYPETRKSLR